MNETGATVEWYWRKN